MKYILSLCLLLLVLINPLKVIADDEQKWLTPSSTVPEIITYYGNQYGANTDELLKVAKCESDFNPNNIGDHGLARGIFQYHPEAFKRMSKLMGKDLKYNNTNNQAELTAFIFANYPKMKAEWTCSKITHII